MKAVVLISGGIDSPLAAYLAAKKGFDIVLLHAVIDPSSDHSKVKKLRKKLEELTGQKIDLYFVPHHLALTKIEESCDIRLKCVLCKRFMYRYAQELAKKVGADVIITGENIGQVASQTPENLITETQVLEIPILRPLIAYNKQEIIDKAKEVGLYDISIESSPSCTCAPPKPRTKSTVEEALIEEEFLDVDQILNEEMKSIRRE